jgi:prophage tail gpP-like protein
VSGEQPGRVSIVLADGTEVQGFDEYRIRQDIRIAGGSFTAMLSPVRDPGLAESMLLSRRTTVLVDGAPQFVGRVGEADCRGSRSGSQMAITGMDLLGIACRSALPLGFSVAGMTCREALAAALATVFGDETPEVIGTNDANRELVSVRRVGVPEPSDPHQRGHARGLPDDYIPWMQVASPSRLVRSDRVTELMDRDERELLPMPGENIGSWVARVCEHYRLLCWATGDGKIVLGRPRYDQTVIPLRWGGPGQEGTIQEGGPLLKPIDAVARQQVAGRVGRHGEAAIFTEATDDLLVAAGWRTLDVQVDEGLRDLAAAAAKAARLIHDSQLDWWTFRARLAGHAIGLRLPTFDMMFHVNQPLWNVDSDLYCAAREFAKSRDGGTVADLTLVRPNLLAA